MIRFAVTIHSQMVRACHAIYDPVNLLCASLPIYLSNGLHPLTNREKITILREGQLYHLYMSTYVIARLRTSTT